MTQNTFEIAHIGKNRKTKNANPHSSNVKRDLLTFIREMYICFYNIDLNFCA